jgi:hypothetical protein
MTLLAASIVPLFFMKKRLARVLLIVYFAGTFVIGIVNHVINVVVAAPGAPSPSIVRVIGSAVIGSLWIRYLISKRVRQTFVRP